MTQMIPMNDRQEYIPPILLALFVAIIPHVAALPLWIVAWCIFMWGYVLVCMKYGRPMPGRLVRNIIAVVGLIGLLLTYHTRLDSSAYISLLAIMAAIKPLEVSTHRDGMVTVFLAYFIIITSLLQTETLLITLYMFISVLVTTAVLVRINDPGGRFREQFRVSGAILLQALPLMLVLFFLFPRMDGSLVGITRTDTGVTGFSERLRPGSVSRLVEDNAVAFRVEFDDDIPGFGDLYWRGIVFAHFDGTGWRHERRVRKVDDVESTDDAVGYNVILEPHRSRWLFALDYPATIPEGGMLLEDFTVLSQDPVHRTKRYAMASGLRDHTGETADPKAHYTNLPESGNPESRFLAADFAANAGTTEAIVRRGLDYFRENDFIYTLNPPLLGADAIDDFLFDSQSGYCEHYASAFAFLMRSAGVPARVVGGYLGGEINPYGNYLIVRQSYAHAWVEVWDREKGWSRVDPTLAVAPGRLSDGPAGALSPGEIRGFAQNYLRPFSSYIDQLRYGWDAFSKNWDAWFGGYSLDQQKALLERLGIDYSYRSAPVKLLLAAITTVFLLFGAYFFLHFRRRGEKPDNVKKHYDVFLKKLARTGVEKPPWAGPLEFARDAARRRPDLAGAIYEITNLYIALRYAPAFHEEANGREDAYVRLERAVKAFSPRKNMPVENSPASGDSAVKPGRR